MLCIKMQVTSLQVTTQLVAAFQNSAKPRIESLTVGTSLEGSMIRAYLSSRTWQDLTPEALDDYDSRGDLSVIPSFLSSTAFAYYAPALMIYTMQRGSHAGLLLDSLMAALIKHAQTLRQMPAGHAKAVQCWLEHMESVFADDSWYLNELAKAKSALA